MTPTGTEARTEPHSTKCRSPSWSRHCTPTADAQRGPVAMPTLHFSSTAIRTPRIRSRRDRKIEPDHRAGVLDPGHLEAHRPLRPQAASRQEELERSEARRAAEDGILELTAEWQERMARARQAQEAATAAHGAEPAVEEETPPAAKQTDADPAAIASMDGSKPASITSWTYWPGLTPPLRVMAG